MGANALRVDKSYKKKKISLDAPYFAGHGGNSIL